MHSVVIDRQAMIGRMLTQVADAAAMRTFATVLPERASGDDMIPTLFDDMPLATMDSRPR